MRQFIIAGVCVAVIAVAVVLYLDTRGHSSHGAAIACENMVEQRLGRDGVTFAGADEYTSEELSNGNYRVRSWYVDPATGFRTSFQCTVEPFEDDKGRGYRPVEIIGDR